MPLLSQSARRRLLEEVQQHVTQHFTKDPAMPGPLRALIGTLSRIFWADIALEFDQPDLHTDDDGETEDLAAAPSLALGMLQVLVVEARDLAPVHGIGTNPYVRGVLGQHVRRTHTAWSTLSPAWNCLIDFPVISLKANLELEVLSRAPLLGSDTRIGYVSVALKDIIPPAAARRSQHTAPQLAYRCEPLLGAPQGQLVLILDWRALQQRAGHSKPGCCGKVLHALWRWAARFRAFLLYHYWPCDKSIFQMYLKEPVDAFLLMISLSPFLAVRAVFYTVLLMCLCTPWPPDEHQIVQFILAFKGTASLTDGAGQMVYGIMQYYSCLRAGTCASGSTPGSGINIVSIALDLYQEMLVWCVCFFLLPRSIAYGMRTGTSAAETGNYADIHRGGRIKSLLQYNLLAFAFSMCIFVALSLWDILRSSVRGNSLTEVWTWQIPENLFWSRVLFGMSMFPFLFLLHPQINKLLTHSTPTGFTRLGTLRQYNPRLRPRKPKHHGREDSPPSREVQQEDAQPPDPPANSMPATAADPMEDLRSAIQRIPGGSAVLCVGKVGLNTAGTCLSITSTIVSLQMGVASNVVSLGCRAVNSGVSGAQHVALCIPGSRLALHAGDVACSSIQHASGATLSRAFQLGEAVSAVAAKLAGQVPGGALMLHILEEVSCTAGSCIAAMRSPGAAAEGAPLTILRVSTEKAEALKLEAAARLAEIITRAELLAEREAVEIMERVRPEIDKISQELCTKGRGCRARLSRAYSACDTLRRSVLAGASDVVQRLPATGETLVQASRREWEDLKAERPRRAKGWMPMLGAHCRAVISVLCEASLELRPGVVPRTGQASEPACLPSSRLQAQAEPLSVPQQDLSCMRRTKSQSPKRRSAPAAKAAAASQAASPEARRAQRRHSSSVPPRCHSVTWDAGLCISG
mmetsp:Transcript_63617/g.186080  ORF Transcript_63617/g.186080 Transcript_63617/m.186080 type:complete len:919 (+) Transcript_63617:78-2834(+)